MFFFLPSYTFPYRCQLSKNIVKRFSAFSTMKDWTLTDFTIFSISISSFWLRSIKELQTESRRSYAWRWEDQSDESGLDYKSFFKVLIWFYDFFSKSILDFYAPHSVRFRTFIFRISKIGTMGKFQKCLEDNVYGSIKRFPRQEIERVKNYQCRIPSTTNNYEKFDKSGKPAHWVCTW